MKLEIHVYHHEDEHMSQQLDDLKAEVAANRSVTDSAIVLLNGISKQISDAVAAAEAGDTAALSQLATDLKSETDDLSAAVSANTPAATPAP